MADTSGTYEESTMYQFLRKTSQARRVTGAFALNGLLMVVFGATFHALLNQAANGAAAAAAVQSLAGWMLGLSIAMAVGAVVTGQLIATSIKRPVEATVAAVQRIAGGDLETRVESPGKDELSWLNHELNQMRKKLRTTVIEVRDSVVMVHNASDEIARGNADLSTRTESQAATLEQTASSMQQLRDTVQNNARHAQEASGLAQQTSRIASEGSALMSQVVDRMGEIHSSAARIGEIIGVIDGIAFQTNILALNAAVEAARAGEQGRGFAVVAAEVRSLAQRSANAAKEIKTLIGTSTERVDAGADLVNQAGRTMGDILGSVDRVATIVAEIANGGSTQSDGLSQLHDAIAQMDQATQQNAALVEEAAAAAQSLNAQAGRLRGSVDAFHVVG
jgi:methyl-accepting chemotaxis protein